MRTRRFKNYELETGCGVEACLEVIGGKWKGLILHHLMEHGTLRFSQIQKLKPALSPRILTSQLRELENDGVILRKVYPVVPPKVEYSLSSAGESLRGVVQAMQTWGDRFIIGANTPVKPNERSQEITK
ncbi:Transcriptional regulator, HxlR family [Acidisarcina polymorpha]|uniref:Transcriptional regulator, HxlR family n=1 Tax=Acidisarcina polymorpha TaxID=2211140 RepID=A0A2Z5FZZ0_9BACT|nr:helix-turn-helix domain-containing protein [Acidisarcina polymorpha]AXC12310.1 Transcriptional regulator, HxlR family [Acidisarcina polymorpha]